MVINAMCVGGPMASVKLIISEYEYVLGVCMCTRKWYLMSAHSSNE